MEKKYILTAIFETKFGKGKKYYDGTAWHWMLNSDKPQLYNSIEEAKKVITIVEDDTEEGAEVKEVCVFKNVWEHKISQTEVNDFFQVVNAPRDVIFESEQRKHFVFLSTKKQHESAIMVDGLYCVDKKTDKWIFCVTEEMEEKGKKPEYFVKLSYKKLEEAKALMQIFDFSETEIKKLDGVMMFVQKIIKDKSEEEISEQEVADNPKILIQQSYDALESAKGVMISKNFEKTEVAKIDGLMLFVKKLLS